MSRPNGGDPTVTSVRVAAEAVAEPPRTPQPPSATAVRNSVSLGTAILVAAATLAVVYGLVLRAWLLVQLPIWGDEAIVGIMARAIDGGHFTAFYWGQHYGGLEPYFVAVGLKVAGGGEPAMNATPAVLSAVGAVLVGAVTLAATRCRSLAFAAAATAWVWPYVVIWQSVREGGFREATLCAGLAAFLCCVTVYLRRAGPGTFVVLGVSLGLGWWASPEIAYFALPCLVLFCAWWWTALRLPTMVERSVKAEPRRRAGAVLVLGGFLLGSLPWWWANAHTGFASLKSSSFPANAGATYGSRLSVFFHDALPMQLGLRAVMSGDWVGGPTLGKLFYVVLLVMVATAMARAAWVAFGNRATLVPLALSLGVLAYPFLYAAAPGTSYWSDGRYGLYLPPLVVLLFATSLATTRSRVSRRNRDHESVARRALALAAVGVLGALCLTVAGARTAGVPAGFFTSWHQGDAPMQDVVHALRVHHIADAYGDYWTAYDLDFLSGGHPAISPSPLDVVRSTALAAEVASSKDPAWLFFAPGQTSRAATVFFNPQPGPGPYTEQTFEAHLEQLGISYQVVNLGILDAVVPARKLSGP